jgi:hypothetical protein
MPWLLEAQIILLLLRSAVNRPCSRVLVMDNKRNKVSNGNVTCRGPWLLLTHLAFQQSTHWHFSDFSVFTCSLPRPPRAAVFTSWLAVHWFTTKLALLSKQLHKSALRQPSATISVVPANIPCRLATLNRPNDFKAKVTINGRSPSQSWSAFSAEKTGSVYWHSPAQSPLPPMSSSGYEFNPYSMDVSSFNYWISILG